MALADYAIVTQGAIMILALLRASSNVPKSEPPATWDFAAFDRTADTRIHD